MNFFFKKIYLFCIKKSKLHPLLSICLGHHGDEWLPSRDSNPERRAKEPQGCLCGCCGCFLCRRCCCCCFLLWLFLRFALAVSACLTAWCCCCCCRKSLSSPAASSISCASGNPWRTSSASSSSSKAKKKTKKKKKAVLLLLLILSLCSIMLLRIRTIRMDIMRSTTRSNSKAYFLE